MAHDELITLGQPRQRLSQDLLHNPGGFVWWYVDALDEQLNGLVLIWSFGLPFLPGYLQAARDGRPEPPGQHPSLNIALYRDGRPCFYSLQSFSPKDAEWSDDYWRFGRTTIVRSEAHGRRQVTARLDVAVPRSQHRLRGTIEVEGAVPTLHPDIDATPGTTHEWCPVTGPARCAADLNWGPSSPFRLDAWAYHDRNAGDRPFDDLGIDHWIWGRTVGPNGTRIHYLVWPKGDAAEPRTWVFDMSPDGEITRRDDADVQAHGPSRAWFGVPFWRRVDLGPLGEVRTGRIVEDGPFYLRSINGGPDPAGESRAGWGEWIRPDRIDLNTHRPLVRMRVHKAAGTNSFWLPLFVGPRSSRVRRLLGLGG